MSEIHVIEQSGEEPDSTQNAPGSASVLPFPAKKGKTEPLAPGEARPGEWEAELPDDQPDDNGNVAEGDPVDPPKHEFPPSIAEVIEAKDKARRPVLPDWLTSAKQRAAVTKWAAGHYGQTTAYHLVRTPVYSAKLLAYAPRGAFRWVGATGRWVSDAEGLPVRLAAVRTEDAGSTSSSPGSGTPG